MKKINWEQKYLKLNRQMRKANEYAMAQERTECAKYQLKINIVALILTIIGILGTYTLLIGKILEIF